MKQAIPRIRWDPHAIIIRGCVGPLAAVHPQRPQLCRDRISPSHRVEEADRLVKFLKETDKVETAKAVDRPPQRGSVEREPVKCGGMQGTVESMGYLHAIIWGRIPYLAWGVQTP